MRLKIVHAARFLWHRPEQEKVFIGWYSCVTYEIHALTDIVLNWLIERERERDRDRERETEREAIMYAHLNKFELSDIHFH